MTDEEIEKLAARIEGDPDKHTWQLYRDTADAIRQLMRERDEAHRDGQRDMQLRALAVANSAGIFARIMELEITRQPQF